MTASTWNLFKVDKYLGFGFSGDYMGQIRYDIHKDSVPSLKLLEEFPKITFAFGDKAQTSSLSHLDFL